MRNESLLHAVERYLEAETDDAGNELRSADRAMLLRRVRDEVRHSPETEVSVRSTAFKRILVAIDESEQSAFAMDVAAQLTRDLHSQLALVHVVHRSSPTSPDLAYEQIDLRQTCLNAGKTLLDEAAKRLEPQILVETFLREGDPVTQISDVATRLGADLLILGTHGRSRFSAAIVGSVAQGVMRHASCPVLCVAHDPAAALGHRARAMSYYADYFPSAMDRS